MIGLGVYRDGDWLHFERERERYDSINTLVMHGFTTIARIPIGDREVRVQFQYPVHSSK